MSICLSIHHTPVLYRNSCTDEADFFAYRFPSTYAMMCFREISVSPKITVLPSGTLSQTLDLENFAMKHQWYANAISNATAGRLVFMAAMVQRQICMACTVLLELHRFDLLWICWEGCVRKGIQHKNGWDGRGGGLPPIQLVWMGWQSIRIVGASACVIFILHQKIQ